MNKKSTYLNPESKQALKKNKVLFFSLQKTSKKICSKVFYFQKLLNFMYFFFIIIKRRKKQVVDALSHNFSVKDDTSIKNDKQCFAFIKIIVVMYLIYNWPNN